MSGDTSIAWTDKVWNPLTGCTRVSAGCDHCYAFAVHDKRHLAWKRGWWDTAPAQYHVPFSRVQLLPEWLTEPLHWRKPSGRPICGKRGSWHEAPHVQRRVAGLRAERGVRMKRTPIRPVSAKRARLNRKRTEVLRTLYGSPCAVRWDSGCQGVGTTLHEPLLRSRGGDPTVADGNVWTCGPCHAAIHANPLEATERGLMRRAQVAQ